MKLVNNGLIIFSLSMSALAGCSKGFEPGTKEPPPPKPPTTRIGATLEGNPQASSPHPISNPKLKDTMLTMNSHFMAIMTNMNDPSKLPAIAEAAKEIVKKVPQIKSFTQEARYQRLADAMQSHAEAVAASAAKGNSAATLKAARRMIMACESCHAVYRAKGRLLGQ